jgi:hypothetical protein
MAAIDYPNEFNSIGWENLGLPFWYGKRIDQISNGTNGQGINESLDTKWLTATANKITYLQRYQLSYRNQAWKADQPSIQLYIYDGSFDIINGEFKGGTFSKGYSVEVGHTNPQNPNVQFRTYTYSQPITVGKGIPYPFDNSIKTKLDYVQTIGYSSSTTQWSLIGRTQQNGRDNQLREYQDFEDWDDAALKLSQLGFPKELIVPTIPYDSDLGLTPNEYELNLYQNLGFILNPKHPITLPSLYFQDFVSKTYLPNIYVSGVIKTSPILAGARLQYRYRIDEADWTKWYSGKVGTNSFRLTKSGKYELEVRQIDSEKNVSDVLVATPFELDINPPKPIITRSGSFTRVINNQYFNVIEGQDADPNRPVEIRIENWSAVTNADESGSFSYTMMPYDIQAIGQGRKKLLAYQTDQAGNTGRSEEVVVNIQTTKGTKNFDILTGSNVESDIFVWTRLSDARASRGKIDAITNYDPEDKILFLDKSYKTEVSQSVYSIAEISPRNLSRILTKETFKPNAVASIEATDGKGAYLVFNDGKAGFSVKNDGIILLENFYSYSPGAPIIIA